MTKIKEPMFFNNYKQNLDYKVLGSKSKKLTTFEDYLKMFEDVSCEKAIGEASPAYIYNKKAPQLIKENLHNVRIIAILRQPVDRAYSNYLHVVRAGKENSNSFEESIEKEKERINEKWSPLYHYIQKGYYTDQLQRYYDLFPSDKIKVYLFEDVIKNPGETLKDIFRFLEIVWNYGSGLLDWMTSFFILMLL